MEKEGSLARKSAILGPVINIVDRYQSGDCRGVLDTIDGFFEGTEGGCLLEQGYQQWREGLDLQSQVVTFMADLIQKDRIPGTKST